MPARVRAGDFIFLSGLIAIDPATGERAHGTTVSETRLILSNLAKILEGAGSSLGKVVKTTVWLASMLETGEHERRLPAVLSGRSAGPHRLRRAAQQRHEGADRLHRAGLTWVKRWR